MLEKVDFRAELYGLDIARILALRENGARLMPLVRGECVSTPALEAVKQLSAPSSVQAGLYLYFSCWDEAHSMADSLENADGYFWHAIVHRQEPDAWNSGYWFQRVGTHPTYSRLAAEATEAGYGSGSAWDPLAFVEFCESARKRPGSKEERLAMVVQRLEWQLLFDHCSRGSAR
jgi:hypothetical protein